MKKFLPLLLILMLATLAMAQNKGRMVGTLTTADGAVIVGAKVTISSDSLISSSLMTTSNDRGMYRFVLLPVGTYSLKIEKEGYKTIEQTGIDLGFEATVTLNKVMETSEFEDVITITGEAPVVDKTSSSISDKLDIEFLQNQANTRNIWAMPNLSAGFTDDSGFGGVQDAGNAFMIDGNNVSDPATGTVFASVNFEAVEQVDVSLFGAPAEYGSFTGAAINVVTKSGGNDFSGEANFYAQRVDWVSDNTTEFARINAPTAADVNNFAGALGGPIVKDQIWFFGNYNYEKRETQRQILDGPITVTEDPQRWFGKVSARWDDKHITYGSYSHRERLRSHRTYQLGWAQNWESSLWSQETDEDQFNIQHSFVVNDSLILEGKYALFRGFFNLVPRLGDDAPLMIDLGTGQHLPGSNANRHDEIDRDRDNFLLTANYYNDDLGGTHSFKFGFEYESSLSARFLSITDFQQWFNGVPLQRFDLATRDGGTRIERFGGFAQDSWSVNDRLTVNYGFRFDATTLKADDPGSAPIGDADVFDYSDPAYRLGFAYDLMGDGKTVVRGFVGRFYEGVVSQNTESFVTTVPPTITSRWNGTDWFVFNVSGGSGNVFIDNDYSNQFTEGVSLGIEQEIMENIAGAVTFIYKKDKDIVGAVAPDATWTQVDGYSFSNANGSYNGTYFASYRGGARTFLSNPEPGDIGVGDDLVREYYGVAAELNKRMSDNWSLKANYTFSRNTGTAGQGFSVIQAFSSYSNPNGWINSDGRLGLERPHVLKVSGTYIAPFDIYISPAFTAQSGRPYGLLHQPATGATLLIKPIDGEERYDNQFNLDMRVEKAFVIQNRYRIGIIADIFNVFNDDAVTGFFSRRIESSNFEVPSSIVGARFYQVGVRLLF